jgi:actin-related protein
MSIKSSIERQNEENTVIEYVVYKENTLGYIFLYAGQLMLGVLGSILINGGLHDLSGPYTLLESDITNLRKATLKDFEVFRVSSKGHFA